MDGGATAQILTLPRQVVITDQTPPDSSRWHLHLVVNSKLGRDFYLVKPRTIPIPRAGILPGSAEFTF